MTATAAAAAAAPTKNSIIASDWSQRRFDTVGLFSNMPLKDYYLFFDTQRVFVVDAGFFSTAKNQQTE